MNLKIVNEQSAEISIKFGITSQRRDELLAHVEKVYWLVAKGTVTPLVAQYEKIAEACNTIEEYTMCMHCFIMNISKIGRPIDDSLFKN